jgi:hypothetical protein
MNEDDGLINEYGNACLSVGQFREQSIQECERRQQRVVAARKALSERMDCLRSAKATKDQTQYQLWLYYPGRPTDNWCMVEFFDTMDKAKEVLQRYMKIEYIRKLSPLGRFL